MKEKNMTFRREELEKLSTPELDKILRTELDSDTPERETVLLVLSILEERDPTDSENRPEGAEEIWENFLRSHPQHIEDSTAKANKKTRPRKWLGAVAAAAVLAIVLLMTVPQTVGAESIFDILGRWTRDLFNFAAPDGISEGTQDAYIFHTENEDLQQVYNVVKECGVTESVVPTWIPDGYELRELRTFQQPISTKIYVRLAKGDSYIQIVVECYNSKAINKYPKDDANVAIYDSKGVYYYIVPNEDTWKVIWNNGNTECSLVTNETEVVLYQILNSIQGRKPT